MNEILLRLAPRLGAEVIVEPDYGFVGLLRFPNGSKSFFWDNKFNLNPLSSVKIAQDKGYTNFFLKSLGYSVPTERTFFRKRFRRHLATSRGIEDAYKYAKELGLPVFLKPCRRSQGQLIAKVHNRKEFYQFSRSIFEHDRVMIVQQTCLGADYRIIVLDGKILCAYRREPLRVTGDGCSSVIKLLNLTQEAFRSEGRDTIIPIADERIITALKRQRLKLDSVLQAGKSITLLDVANLSLGGTLTDITESIHPDYSRLCVRVTHDMDLRFCGVDLMTENATQPLADYSILEINSAPGLDNYLFSGRRQQEYVDDLYLEVLSAIMYGKPSTPREGSVP